jgi:hypothetical protein
MKKKICLHQFAPKRISSIIKVEGEGNCNICIPNDKNNACRLFTRIVTLEYDVKKDSVD